METLAEPASATKGDLQLLVAGETLRLLPEKAIYWERCSTLLVADTHWGKAASFRAASIPIPQGTTQADLERLSHVIERTHATRLIVLGDLLHSREGRSAATFEKVTQWRRRHENLRIELIQGNHDLQAGLPLADWKIVIARPPVIELPFVWQHEPQPHAEGFVLAGHIHPSIVLKGLARQTLRLPCFHLQQSQLTLPAFSSFAGGYNIKPGRGDRIFPVADTGVVEIPCQ
ncbi:ligase-associated DNA damage response endonuclease PdeM [Planctopirus hydrillae]|uniref:ligase-associated DNA damage response endonuclease PdeM n=1 Tax=Planctopirus hydrillae TaxID=1841610 RepID=UPI00197C1DEA|nr:ligase-associated DNA damage response endonuclease PdeM [Planctopirus hydrillae]